MLFYQFVVGYIETIELRKIQTQNGHSVHLANEVVQRNCAHRQQIKTTGLLQNTEKKTLKAISYVKTLKHKRIS